MSFIGDILSGTPAYTPQQLQKPVSDAEAQAANQQANQAIQQQQQFLQALQGQNGIQNQSDVYNQLSQVAQGQGPNPAQAMLNQATAANVANQAALMAGQRGTGANAGLLARQAANQGGALQQQAVGQGATMQANQSLGALGQMGGLATQQVGQQQQATANLNQFAQGNQQNLLGAIGSQNQATLGQDQLKANLASQAQQRQMSLAGGLLNAAGSVVAGPMAAGAKQLFSAGGGGAAPNFEAAMAAGHGAKGYADGGMIQAIGKENYSPSKSKASQHFKSAFAAGGQVPKQALPMAPVSGEALAAQGQMVPGQAKHPGDNYSNDVVPARLSPGEIVLPRSVTMSEDPVGNAAKFVAAVMAKQASKKKGK